MDLENKQWVLCHPMVEPSGGVGPQLGPEDLSATSIGRNMDPEKQQHHRQLIPPNINSVEDDQNGANVHNKNGLDQFFLQQVEDAICESSRQAIVHILDEVAQLSSIEKLLLYLKLPTDTDTVTDPLRQPLNPLGSRTEISQTIMWIRTHLEEDPELSLPKQEVFNEYTIHCANNKMKPLSTADFGKVMKQVYSSVRPRRLGTRGNSRYCYAGLRKRFKLEVPQLPDLGDRPQSTEILCSSSNELTTAVCTIICEWAETILGTHFQSIYILASYLIRNAPHNINISSQTAALLANYAEGIHPKEMAQELLPYSNHVNLRHRDAQLQLQRKLQQRDYKRKMQLQSPKMESKSRCKRSKSNAIGGNSNNNGPPSRALSLDSTDSSSPKSQGYQLNAVCDNKLPVTTTTTTNECTISIPPLPPSTTSQCTLPEFSSFNKTKPLINEIEMEIGSDNTKLKPILRSNSVESTEDEIKANPIGKLPIPRLPTVLPIHKQKTTVQQQQQQQPKTVILHVPKKNQRNPKYKTIQPKCDEVEPIQIASALKSPDLLTRERLMSVSNVEKDALDDYLHGDNNSQEQEEELLKYFKNNNNGTPKQSEPDEKSKSDKLSQLRLLLEQNLVTETTIGSKNTNTNPNAFIKTPIGPNVQMNPAVKRRVSFETSVIENDASTVPASPNTRRKNFSFTPISPGSHSPPGQHSKCSSTNASPFVSPRNTPVPRAKTGHVTGSFIAQQQQPISVRKHLNVARPVLKMTKPDPDPDPDPNPNPNLVYTETENIFNEYIEEKHFVNPTDIIPKCLPMSAPPSPLLPYKQKITNSNNNNNGTNLLHKLLDSSSKVSYVPNYEKNVQEQQILDPLSQEVTQLMSGNNNNGTNFQPVEPSYRSQSVPLHQMTSFKTLISPCVANTQMNHFNFNFASENNSVAPTPIPAEFSDFETFNDLNANLNNENFNQILNIFETNAPSTEVSSTQQNENIFNFDTSLGGNNTEMLSVQRLMRSQSIDVDSELRSMYVNPPVSKYIQPSRSVPSTPLPYKTKGQLDLNLNDNLFACRTINEQDFLINGQPIKGKYSSTFGPINGNENFPSSLGFTMNDNNTTNMNDNKLNNFMNGNDFGARRNLNPLLEQQQYAAEQQQQQQDEFNTTAVPRG